MAGALHLPSVAVHQSAEAHGTAKSVQLSAHLPANMQEKMQHAKQVISVVAQQSRRAILFYSGGKDSIALLDLIAPHFDEIVLVFMYFVKGLEHIEQYLTWASRTYPNVKVIQVPHWNLSYIRSAGVFCIPDPSVRILKLKDIDNAVRARTGIEWSFLGFKQADSLNRRLMLKGYDKLAISPTKKAYPLSVWNQADVMSYISTRNLPAPISYTSGKKSHGVGFHEEVYLYLQEHYPNDLQKILTEFPLSQKLLIDHAKRQK